MDNNVLKMPVDVIDNGTRRHYNTREEAIADYFEAMMMCEGSAKERYAKIYTNLVYHQSDVVSDGVDEIVPKEPVGSSLDKTQILEMIKNDEMSINDIELFDKGKCKLLYEDRDIVKALLVQDGWYAAQFLRKYIENDKELIVQAARGGDEPRGALVYASKKLQDDKEFVMQLIELDASDVQFVSDRLCNDPEVIAAALRYAENDYDVDSVKNVLGEELLSNMLKVYLDKQRETENEITAKFDFKSVPEELIGEYYVETFDTAEEMFNDLYLYDADRETLRDAICVLKQQSMHEAVVEHMNVRYDGEKYYYSSEMEAFEDAVFEWQKGSLENKIAEAKEVGRDLEKGEPSITKGKDKDAGR